MKVWFVVILTFASFFATSAAAEDFQLRLIAHRPPRTSFNLVGWAIAPDLTVSPKKGLTLAGIGTKTTWGWVEVIAGGFVVDGERFQPAVNIRLSARKGKTSAYTELWWRSSRDRPSSYRRWAGVGVVTYAVTTHVALGFEGEEFFGRSAKPSLGIGPRASVKFGQKTSLALGWQMRNASGGTNFVRLYTLRTF